METKLRDTRSVCPVCLKNLPASLLRQEDGSILLRKQCEEHGEFSVPVWQGAVDFDRWTLGADALPEGAGESCPGGCGLCPEHETESCCVLLEVTRRCNLRCRFCFANGGSAAEDVPRGELEAAIREIGSRCKGVMLQLSGGEPTLRDDLPELVRFAKTSGCAYVQVNTNGLRLAAEPDYAERLAEAGLDIVFLQFDGTREEIYTALRGRPLLQEKLAAIRVCAALKIGVTLVPTVVSGVNTEDLGNLVRLAASLAPGVRGVHFQPVSYFGRYPKAPAAAERYTLDRLMAELSEQAGIPLSAFLPSRCDHPLCGFHAGFLLGTDGALKPLSDLTRAARNRGCAAQNREYIARRWRRQPEAEPAAYDPSKEMDFDTFLYQIRNRSLTLSAMAFQDAMNLNIERLHRCSLHVYDHGTIRPFCAAYLTAVPEETK